MLYLWGVLEELFYCLCFEFCVLYWFVCGEVGFILMLLFMICLYCEGWGFELSFDIKGKEKEWFFVELNVYYDVFFLLRDINR